MSQMKTLSLNQGLVAGFNPMSSLIKTKPLGGGMWRANHNAQAQVNWGFNAGRHSENEWATDKHAIALSQPLC